MSKEFYCVNRASVGLDYVIFETHNFTQKLFCAELDSSNISAYFKIASNKISLAFISA
jgi:hypothetical protein